MALYLFTFAVICKNGEKTIIQKPISTVDHLDAEDTFDEYLESDELSEAGLELCDEVKPSYLYISPEMYKEWGSHVCTDPSIPVGANSTKRPQLRPVD